VRFGGWSAPAGIGRVEPDGLSLEIVHRLWSDSRTAASLAITPSWSRWRELGGESGETAGLDAALRLEGTLVPSRLFAAANLGMSTSRETGVSFQDPSTAPVISTQLDASVAIAGRLAANLYLAFETRLAAAADGSAVSVSAGPSLNLSLSDQATLSASFTPGLGASGDPDALDGLSENRFQLELSIEF
jgi:hypothetical protein